MYIIIPSGPYTREKILRIIGGESLETDSCDVLKRWKAKCNEAGFTLLKIESFDRNKQQYKLVKSSTVRFDESKNTEHFKF